MNYKTFEALKTEGKSLVFVWGDFNILHPGHLRLLNFAADCGDILIVGIRSDAESSVVIPADIRLQSLQSISVVKHAFVLDETPEAFIKHVKPAVVVKGQEHKGADNPEKAILDQYGGELIFSSGEMRFSSIDLLRREGNELAFKSILKPRDYLKRHEIDSARLSDTVRAFNKLNVVVIGDLIVDEYINCDPLGMSQEDPTIVVTPISRDKFIGGAGIVAAHAKGLGANVRYITVCGNDASAEFAKDRLQHYGVTAELMTDHSRPTTLKQRYRAKGKTLLRVSELKQHEISDEIGAGMLDKIRGIIKNTSLVIFSDFNYGCLPQSLVDQIAELCNQHKVPMFADSQSSSQVGDITRFKGMTLVTPTEHEVRLALGDSTSGLVVLAEKLAQKARCQYSFITLGSEGAFVHSPKAPSHKIITDALPAMNLSPKDVAGAGDSMLTCTAMALVAGANIWQAAFLGSIAAACQVGRVGNRPLSAAEIIEELEA
jgi:rfaE bifunctional protein kinase chain/domain